MLDMEEMYCVKCRAKKKVDNPKKVEFKTKNGKRNAFQSVCPDCGTKMTKFTK